MYPRATCNNCGNKEYYYKLGHTNDNSTLCARCYELVTKHDPHATLTDYHAEQTQTTKANNNYRSYLRWCARQLQADGQPDTFLDLVWLERWYSKYRYGKPRHEMSITERASLTNVMKATISNHLLTEPALKTEELSDVKLSKKEIIRCRTHRDAAEKVAHV